MSKIYQKSHPAGKNAGFTLIELLVVVLIIGTLAAVALPQYQVAVLKSRVATTMSAVKTIAEAAEVYYMANGEYPDDDITVLDISGFSGCTTATAGVINCSDKSRFDLNSGKTKWSNAEYIVAQVWQGEGYAINYRQYLQHSPYRPGERLCVAQTETAHKVCKSLGGELISGSSTDYKLP